MILWALLALWGRQKLAFPIRHIRVPLLLAGMAFIWALIQMIPNVPFDLAHPAWGEVHAVLSENTASTISIDPEAGATIIMRWLAYGSVFWLALQFCVKRENANLALLTFVYVSGAYALYGLLAHLSGSNTILFYDKWTYENALTSTFVNRNSYATYAGMGLLAVSLLFAHSMRAQKGRASNSRQRILDLLSQRNTKNLVLLGIAFLITTALLLTGSRAGAACTAFALLVAIILYSRWERMSLNRNFIGAAILAVALSAVGISSDFLQQRLSDVSFDGRQQVYNQTLLAIDDHFFVGSGLGSFPQVFTLYRSNDGYDAKFWDKAHNTYLENALELGVPAALALNLALVALVVACCQGVRNRKRDQHFAILGLSVSVLVGLHSLIDFSLQIPGVTITYVFLLGLAVAQSVSSRRL